MSFGIDKQTLEELNLLGKFRQGSVYHLFNRVKTRGGEQLLDDMFRFPLTDANAINQRSRIFQYFQEEKFVFPFDVKQVSFFREYLDVSAPGNAGMVLAGTVVKKWLSSLTRDDRYKKMVQGLHAAIVTLQKCHAFVSSVSRADGPFQARLQAMRDMQADKRVEALRNMDIYQALPVRTLARYDHLLKGKLQKQMEDLLHFIYEIDVFIAVSDVAREKSFCYAHALLPEANVFRAESLAHPCIEGAVGNGVHLGAAANVLFLTGANMAGKSTLMKSIGIGCYLAHMGFPVAAAKLEFSVRDGMYTSINVADNIGLGYSHFYAEVVRVKHAAEAAASGKRLLLMFDELFKGTNVKDAYDGTLAVTEGFAGYTACLFVVSTHIIEVGEALQQYGNIRFAFMPTIMDGPRPRYTYQLREGITEDRQGMMIIRNEGILELLNDSI
ncbi:MutS-related protein [Chitinophaga sp. NPDC101104]|uniref:MutS-related protein n=1 Tax=Chitinophaga sp. NPDC101104 TaxID=3390561 RepID=UPI003D0244DD